MVIGVVLLAMTKGQFTLFIVSSIALVAAIVAVD